MAFAGVAAQVIDRQCFPLRSRNGRQARRRWFSPNTLLASGV